MKQPSLEEVKEYFKNAKTVQCICMCDGGSVDITENIETDIHEFNGGYWIDLESEHYIPKGVKLWGNGHWAKILTYKEKTFSITESQIKELSKQNCVIEEILKEWFPEAFESEVKSLPKDYSGWCRCLGIGNEKWIGYFEKGIFRYGIGCYGYWFVNNGKKHNFKIPENYYIEATEQEVFESLKNEAVKRYLIPGKKENPLYWKNAITGFTCSSSNQHQLYSFKDNNLFLANGCIFADGKWSQIIETITLSEAEQQLKKKIIV